MFEEQKDDKKPVFNVDWKPLSDDSVMPGKGKHAGKKMKDVPADYLIWCYENEKCSKDVRAYVVDNMDVLKQQAAAMSKGKSMSRDWGIDKPSNARELRDRPVRTRWRGN